VFIPVAIALGFVWVLGYLAGNVRTARIGKTFWFWLVLSGVQLLCVFPAMIVDAEQKTVFLTNAVFLAGGIAWITAIWSGWIRPGEGESIILLRQWLGNRTVAAVTLLLLLALFIAVWRSFS
jgi:hypothetical protein